MRFSKSALAAAVAVGMMVVAAPASAQRGQTAAQPAQRNSQAGQARPIRFAQTVNDTLRATDTKIGDRGPFRVYRFEARADKRYVITMDASDFDAYIWVARQVGVLTDEIAADDDGGEDTNARLRFIPPATGSYFLVAQALAEESSGGYSLRIEEIDAPPPAMARAINVGQTMTGELNDNSPLLESSDAQPHDVYTLRGKGQRVRILMTAGDFDTHLTIYKVTAEGEEKIDEDDDSGGGTNSRITLTVNGEYKIIARSLSSDGRGAYELSVAEAPMVAAIQRPIAVGELVNNELSASDPELEDGGYYHEYIVTASAGDAFRITMRSGEFDSYLRWGTKDGDNFQELASDDDSGGDLDSMLEVRIDRSGTYVIRVSALSSSAVGPYTLLLERR